MLCIAKWRPCGLADPSRKVPDFSALEREGHVLTADSLIMFPQKTSLCTSAATGYLSIHDR